MNIPALIQIADLNTRWTVVAVSYPTDRMRLRPGEDPWTWQTARDPKSKAAWKAAMANHEIITVQRRSPQNPMVTELLAASIPPKLRPIFIKAHERGLAEQLNRMNARLFREAQAKMKAAETAISTSPRFAA